jgi:hypothetical protein
MRAWAPVIAAVLLSLHSDPVLAQTKPAADDTFGFIGVPEYTSVETGIPFFYKADADLADQATQKMRDAAAKCDRTAYDLALNSLNQAASDYENERPAVPLTPDVRMTLEKSRRDAAALRAAAENRPPFPAHCLPPSRLPLINIWLLGGGVIGLNNTGSVTGVDKTLGAGNFLIDSTSSNSWAAAAGVAGLRAQLTKQWNFFVERELEKSASRNAPYRGAVFIETGIQSGFGAQSFNQSFQGVNTIPQGFGSSTINENLQIPILVGGSVPILSAVTPGGPPVFLNVYGGITLDSWTQTLQGREAGAPGGGGFFGQNQRFTVDPTAGIGFHTQVGNLLFGLNAELQFRPGSVVTAQSPNFPGETYYGTVNPSTNMLVMGRVGFAFGGR